MTIDNYCPVVQRWKMLAKSRIKSKSLKLLFDGDQSKVDARYVRRTERILSMLGDATAPSELAIPGFGFHRLKGDKEGWFSISVLSLIHI